MLYSYGVTRQGTYHIEKDLVCQDAHYCEILGDHFAIAAVADGLGSELYSDVASKIAAEQSVLFCKERITEETGEAEILAIIKESFSLALAKIEQAAAAAGHDDDQYDTTLALAVYRNGILFFGNSGDSGIVVLKKDGSYTAVTEQQRDENGCVFPLCFGTEKWVFGKIENVASILLATDGMYETLFPYLLRYQDVNIYVALARYMMAEDSLRFSELGSEAVQANMEAFIDNIPGEQVNDDKTVLVVLDTEIATEPQPAEYYLAPDWAALKKRHDEEFRRAAYPHLYKDEVQEKAEESDS